MIQLRFVQGGEWDSKLIQWQTRCLWSHVECMLSTGETFGAMLKGGIRSRYLSDPLYKRAVKYQCWNIIATEQQDHLFYRFLGQQAGKPYDWRAIASFGLGCRDWREEDSWFCSELQVRGLEVAGLISLPSDIPVNRITPRDLWILVSRMGSAAEPVQNKK